MNSSIMHKASILPKHSFVFIVLGIFSIFGNMCDARELKVSRTEAGAYRTIQQAVNAAQPGDVILLSPQDSPYYESVSFRNKSGTTEKPIILDGQGATLNGSEALRPDEWEKTEAGHYRSTALSERMRINDALLGRFSFIMNGSANRMGRTGKGNRTPFKAPGVLQPGEWTYVAEEKAFYLNLAAGQELTSVRAPERANGVAFSGDCENIEIRNITATHVWNDGFNIHGRSRDIHFKNIRAIECGDDGISAHGDCHIAVNGFISQRNSTGMCHVNQSRSDNRNVILEDNYGYDVYLLNDSQHTLSNSVVRSTKGRAMRLASGTKVQIKNVLFHGQYPNQTGLLIDSGAWLEAHNISIWNLPLTTGKASVRLDDSVIGGPESAVRIGRSTQWKADRNLWDTPRFSWQETVYSRENFGDYTQASGQDKNSRWETLTFEKVSQGKYAPHGRKLTIQY